MNSSDMAYDLPPDPRVTDEDLEKRLVTVPKGMWFYLAVAILKPRTNAEPSEEPHILMIKRHPKTNPQPDFWELPYADFVWQDTILGVLKQVIGYGVKLKLDKVLRQLTTTNPASFFWPYHIKKFNYLAQVEHPADVRFRGDSQHDDWRWVTEDMLKSLAANEKVESSSKLAMFAVFNWLRAASMWNETRPAMSPHAFVRKWMEDQKKASEQAKQMTSHDEALATGQSS